MTSLRILPDVEALVGGLLDDCPNAPTPPKMLASRVPFRTIYKIAGAAIGRFMDAPHVQVVSWHNTRAGARDLAETGRVRLLNAWLEQYRSELGGIHRVNEVMSPFENRSGTVDGVFRFDATYEVLTRP